MNSLIIHGFLLVKTWLLIACDTAFYAIMPFKIKLFTILIGATLKGKNKLPMWSIFFPLIVASFYSLHAGQLFMLLLSFADIFHD